MCVSAAAAGSDAFDVSCDDSPEGVREGVWRCKCVEV